MAKYITGTWSRWAKKPTAWIGGVAQICYD